MVATDLSARNSIFFSNKNTYEVATPYHPESNGMAERLLCLLKDRILIVNKDQGFNLQRNLNIALSNYFVVPRRDIGFSPFVLFYGCEAIIQYEIPFNRYVLEEQCREILSPYIKKIFETHKGAFFSKRH